MDFPYYPLNDFGPLMKGMVIGGLGILHVFLAQFAIGGGMLLCYFQWLAMTGRSRLARDFIDGYFLVLVLVSFVLGALTGVAMWFTTIQISPRTIGMMLDEFHWVWAIEWTFFCTEVASGYGFYRYGTKLVDPVRLALLAIYTAAAWMSLFWINGILSWQLTPGGWVTSHQMWDGFFNATFWPSLLFRTLSSMATAGLIACVVINFAGKWSLTEKTELLHRAMLFLTPMVLMPFLGGWFLYAMPVDSRGWVLGGSVAMTLFMILGVGASLLIGTYSLLVLFNRKLFINGVTALMLVALALCATAGAEFVREGVRKPYTIRHTLYSNSISEPEVARLREVGSVTADPYPLVNEAAYPTAQLRLGAKVFRLQCSVCHTLDGANGVTHLSGSWTVDQMRLNLAQLQRTKPFMPPFAGTPVELEALVQMIRWQVAGRPTDWLESSDPQVLVEIKRYLDEAGTASAVPHQQ